MTKEELLDEGNRWLRSMEPGKDLTLFVAEMLQAIRFAKLSEVVNRSEISYSKIVNRSEFPDSSTELAVQYNFDGSEMGRMWTIFSPEAAEQVIYAHPTARLMTRTVGPWEVVE